MQVKLQPAYILHTRPYRDTSLLIDVLSLDYGRVSLVGKGIRNQKNRTRSPLYPFTELLLSWQGKSDLKTLTGSEAHSLPPLLKGNHLYCGFYINELVMRLVPLYDSCPEVYQLYKEYFLSIANNENTQDIEPPLRQFEFGLLDAMGYGVDFHQGDGGHGELQENAYYRYVPDIGFIQSNSRNQQDVFAGKALLAITHNDYTELDTRRTAKRLVRKALAVHLGNEELKSRELFGQLNRIADDPD